MRTPLLLMACLATGCASVNTIRDEPLDRGTWHEFAAPAAVVADLARASVQELGGTVKGETHPDASTTVILADVPMTLWSWGEVVRLTTRDLGGQRTSLRVLTDRKLATNATSRDFGAEVISKVAAKLGR